MSRPDLLTSLKRSSTLGLLCVMAVDLALLASDAAVALSGRGLNPAAVLLGLLRLALFQLGIAVITLSSRRRTVETTMLAAFAVNTSCAVLLGHWRGLPETGLAVAAAATTAAAVVLPWGVGCQSVLLLSQILIVGLGLFFYPLPPSSDAFLVIGFGTMAATLYLTRDLARARVRLDESERENVEMRSRADAVQASLEEGIRVRTAHLERAGAEFEELCQAASHDLRPPLRSMAGFGEILKESAARQGRRADVDRLERVIALATAMGTAIDALLAEVRETRRSIADGLATPAGSAVAPAKDARPVVHDKTTATMLDRGRVTLGVLLVLSLLATVSDLFRATHAREVILGLGAARIALLSFLLAVLFRRDAQRRASAATMAGVCLILAISPPLGLLRDQFATVLLIESGLCISAGAFLPWGWRAQLLPMAVTALSVSVSYLDRGSMVIATPILVQMASCMAISLYFAVEHQRAEEELARHAAEIAISNATIRDLNLELERRVAERETLLEQAGRRLESFCQDLARQLKPNLAVTGTELEALASATSPGADDSPLLLSRMEAAVRRMEETLDALLRYVALARSALAQQAVDLSEVAREKLRELEQGEPGRRLAATVQPGMTATGDAALLAEALGQLIENAWKFTVAVEDAEIEVGASTTAAGDLRYFVRDNGVGFEMVYVDKLFRPFTKLDALESSPGHGMGLARALRIVRLHGGTMDAQGEGGEGAEFGFTLATGVSS